jgi:NADH dehydrogenase
VPTARPEHSAYVQAFLGRRHVAVRLGARVTRVEPRRVWLEGGEVVDAFTLIWTAGVCPPPVVRDLPVRHERDGRVRVDGYLLALDPAGSPIEDLYVIGDSAASLRSDGKFQPALSQTSIAMGTHVGAQLVGRATGKSVRPFQFHDVGYIISLGQHSSVLDLFGVRLSGRLAWLAWAGAYLVKMVGLRKQLEVGIDHVIHLFFTHDYSQILNRRGVLSDDELNLSLRAPGEPGAANDGGATPAAFAPGPARAPRAAPTAPAGGEAAKSID